MSRKTTTDASFLDNPSRPPSTKVICSLRPSTSFDTIKHLLLSGMNMCRIACVFGTQKELELLINRIRYASSITKKLCGIILETHGTNTYVGPVLITPKQSVDLNDNDNDINIKQSTVLPLLPLIQSSSNKSSTPDTTNDLQKLANMLLINVDNLPQSIIDNASFAAKHILSPKKLGSSPIAKKTAPKINKMDMDISQKLQNIVTDIKNNDDDDDDDDNDGIDANPMINMPLKFVLPSSATDTKNSPLRKNRRSIHEMEIDFNSASSHMVNDMNMNSSIKISNNVTSGNSFEIDPDIYLVKGSTVHIVTDRIIQGSSKKFSICFPGLCNKLKIKSNILIHPSIKLKIKSINKDQHILTCNVLSGGPLKEYSSVEFPSLKIQFPSITQQDVNDIYFGVANCCEYICVSHVKSLDDIITTKEMIELNINDIENSSKLLRNKSVDVLNRKQSDYKWNQSRHIKVLAKIEDAICLTQINDIISASDGIIIDRISLLHSYKKQLNNQKKKIFKKQINDNIQTINNNPYKQIVDTNTNIQTSNSSPSDDITDDDDDPQPRMMNMSDLDPSTFPLPLSPSSMYIDEAKEKVTEIINSIITETKNQAKPFIICCSIQTNLLSSSMNDYSLADINHDIKLLIDMPNIPININSFLCEDDIVNIEYCISHQCDSICLISDINRLKDIYNEMQVNNIQSSASASALNDINKTNNNDNDLYFVHGIIRSITDIIKKKEVLSSGFYKSHLRSGSYASIASVVSAKSTRNINSNKHQHPPLFKSFSTGNMPPIPMIPITPKGSADIGSNCSTYNEDDDYDIKDEINKMYEVSNIYNSMASSAVKTAYDLNCSLIIVLTQSGRIARIVSKYRPHCIILAITDNEIVAKQCMLISSIFPILVLNMNGTDSLISKALYVAYKHKLIKKKHGEKVIVLAGTQSDILDETCDFIMKLLYVDL